MPNYNQLYGYGIPGYNSAFQNGYQNTYMNPNTPNYQQPVQQPQLNQYAFVNGIEGAKSFQMMPNQTVMLMDSDNPIAYMKTSNAVGQSTIRYFKLIETTEENLKTNNNVPKQEYVLKTDFDVLNNKVEELLSKLEKTSKPYPNKHKEG